MDFNRVLEREKYYIDKISLEYNYDSNIKHLLYLMIPAFIIKYGVSREKQIIGTFKRVRILKSNKQDRMVKAFYVSTPKYIDGKYITSQYMVIQNYDKIGLVDLLDNLIHEFNHALNSYQNELRETKNYLYLRTGLTYRIYRKNDFSFVKKDNSYILEEIINTKQTSDVVNIIKGIKTSDLEISNTIYAINSETNHTYNSDSYYLQSYVCREILENRTFISTLENLRINGEVRDISKWFDDITGEDNSYLELNRNLSEIYDLEVKYTNQVLFKSITVGKIRDLSRKIMRTVNKFNNNVNFR